VNGETCPIEMSDGLPCGREVWRERCLLHAVDESKPSDDFIAQVQRTVEGTDVGQRQPGDLTQLQWYNLPLNRIKWTHPVTLRRAHFRGDARFDDSTFHGRADFTEADFESGLKGNPTFLDDVIFHSAQIDRLFLGSARFAGVADFTGAKVWCDSIIGGATFEELAIFSRGKHGELFFQRCKFKRGVTFAESTFRPSFEATLVERLFDVTRAVVFFKPLMLRGFEGEFRANHARFDGELDLSDSVFAAADFTGAIIQGPLKLTRAVFEQSVSFRGAAIEGALDLSDVQVNGDGILDLSNVSLGSPEALRLVRLNQQPTSPPLRLCLANMTMEGARIENINWSRDPRNRVLLEDEAAVARGETQPQHVVAVYRRLRTIFEANHLYDEAEDCVWGAMEMRRHDKSSPTLTKLALRAYQLASYYGSSYARAFWVLLFMVGIALPLGLAGFGLQTTAANTGIEHQIQGWRNEHQHSVFETRFRRLREDALTRSVEAVQWYSRGLVHTLQTVTFKDETTYQSASVGSQLIETLGRTLVPGQFALLLLALRMRFSR
jgi:uncharacterized protein YjbI with pentapeptide repeats